MASWPHSTAPGERFVAPPRSWHPAKDIGLDLRAGIHSGEVEMRGEDIAGLAVNIAKRVRAIWQDRVRWS